MACTDESEKPAFVISTEFQRLMGGGKAPANGGARRRLYFFKI
jgi:hypothetical protein